MYLTNSFTDEVKYLKGTSQEQGTNFITKKILIQNSEQICVEYVESYENLVRRYGFMNLNFKELNPYKIYDALTEQLFTSTNSFLVTHYPSYQGQPIKDINEFKKLLEEQKFKKKDEVLPKKKLSKKNLKESDLLIESQTDDHLDVKEKIIEERENKDSEESENSSYKISYPSSPIYTIDLNLT